MSTVIVAKALRKVVEAKTADYTVVAADLGKIFTNRAATDVVIFTLPIVTTIQAGWFCEFFVAADFDVTVISAGSLDDLTTFNDLTADSVKYGTATELVGGGFGFIWDGTGWLVRIYAQETQTMTVA